MFALVVFNLEDKMNVEGLNFKFRLDYLAHILAFMPWAVWGYLLKKRKLKWFIWGIVLAMLMEGLHYFVPYRVFNVVDLIANLFGVLLGYVIIYLWFLLKNSKNNFIFFIRK